MNDKNKKLLIITSVICLLPIIAGIVLYGQLPDQMATHFNAKGVADGFSPKAFAVFGIPAILAVANAIAHYAINNDPRGKNANHVLNNISKWICPAVSILINVSMYLLALGY